MRGIAMSIVGSGFIVGGAMNLPAADGFGLLLLGTVIGALGIGAAGKE